MAMIPHLYSPTTFRRHPLRRLPHYVGLAALHGSLLALAFQATKPSFAFPGAAIGFTVASLLALITVIIIGLREYQFALTITPHLIIVDEGFPFGSRKIIERVYISQYHLHRHPLEALADSGTLTITVGNETYTFTGLTSLHRLAILLEGS
jgi:membrane protein YdbS with pleckstrin-like domain